MSAMERPYILHMFTPGPQMSPFDVNMAADAGYQVITPYCGVAPEQITALTQDAIFSRGPKGVARTGIFIGGRDVLLAAEMLERARQAMVPPFVVSLFADPSGAYTTAAALVAATESALRQHHDTGLAGKRVVLLGGTGPVGRIAGVLCAQAGATRALASRKGPRRRSAAAARPAALRRRCTASPAETRGLRARWPQADVVMGVAAAGVQVMSEDDRASATRCGRGRRQRRAARRAGGRRRDGRREAAGRHVGRRHRRAGGRQREVPGAAPAARAHARGRKAVAFGFAEAFADARECWRRP
jgi:methylene-tetrahydromethanopterin dehydrogenase